MPRNFDSGEQKRTGGRLSFTALVECRECGTLYEGTWYDDSQTAEDMVDAPEAYLECPSCEHVQLEAYPGWMNVSEAG